MATGRVPTDIDALIQVIIAARSRGLNDHLAGRVMCMFRALTPAERAQAMHPPSLLDGFVAGELAANTGLPPPEWHALAGDEALVVLLLALTESLGPERIPVLRAMILARRFLACFGSNVQASRTLRTSFPPRCSTPEVA
jgi:hypothetical protein